MIAEMFMYGFISAFGWWTANHYVIEPHFPPAVERKDEKKEKPEKPEKPEDKESKAKPSE
jgi:hypothetical protein